jgi:zinc transport system substrate-binding protein
VEVTTMLAAGGSEHAVELRPRQLAALERAHVYFKVGHPAFLLESQRIVPLLRPRPDVLIVDMLPGLAVSPAPADLPADPPADNDAADEAPGHGHEHGHAHGGEDPHVWLAPSVMRAAARNLERSLQQVDPAHAGDYARNRDAVERELDGVDARIRALLGETMPAPSSNRRFLVYHPAWGYFAREYGLEQVAIEEEGKEPSPLRLIQLIERARALEVDTVFVQRGMSTRSAKVVARELGARVVELDPMALDWKAAMLHAAQQIGRSLRAAADRASGSPGVADSLGAQAPAAPPHAGGTR